MKIIVVSLTYLPAVGGLENIMSGLVNQWCQEHEVVVFTNNTDISLDSTLNYNIVRGFSLKQLWRAVQNADILIEANLSLHTCWVSLLHRKKWFLVHHLNYGNQGILSFIKKQLIRFANNISVSKYVAENLKTKSVVIPNFYNPIFSVDVTTPRNKNLVFVGRLVSDKGANLLIEALYKLKQQGKQYSLTIIGNGPEKTALQQQVQLYQLQEQVVFEGQLTGDLLVKKINEHHVMVVPSKWKEPFGIVALEGLACGCKVVVPNEGGLQEAVGEFGFIFKHNDVLSLVEIIQKALVADSLHPELVEAHLAKHQASFVAQQYILQFNKKRSAY